MSFSNNLKRKDLDISSDLVIEIDESDVGEW